MPSPFDLQSSLQRAEARLAGSGLTKRRRRSDLGALRVAPRAVSELRRLLAGDEFPGVQSILAALSRACERHGVGCPSRATVYKLILREPGRRYSAAGLPPAARAALYNLDADAQVPAAQLAFYCFNYGELEALHFAAGLPWLALYQAYRMRGWRPRSRGLLRAVLVARGIPGD